MQKKLFLEQRCKVVSVCTNGRKKMTAANICLRIVFQSSTYVAALPAPEAKTFSSYFCFLDSSQIFIYQKKKFFLFSLQSFVRQNSFSLLLFLFIQECIKFSLYYLYSFILEALDRKNIISFKIFVMMVGYWKFFLSFELFKNVGRQELDEDFFKRGRAVGDVFS